MKKLIVYLVVGLMSLSMVGCSSNQVSKNEDDKKDEVKNFSVQSSGYGGKLDLNVKINDGKIEDIIVNEHHETSVVYDRAFPIIKDRILNGNTPVVDNVTGATFTSFAIKSAVADAMRQGGMEVEEISFNTSGEAHTAKNIDDVKTDIVVVGGGPAGLTAAIAAKEANPNIEVILIEKLDILSGNGKFDMNFFDLINSKGQKDNGREVTKENFLASISGKESEARLEAWADNSNNLDAWLRSINVNLDYPYGGPTSTSHLAKEEQYAGEVVQAGLEAQALKVGVKIITGTKGNDLVLDGTKVIGVNVTNNELETYNIMASFVILATGGYSHNKELLAEYDPGREKFGTSNQMGATGDFVSVFKKLGYKIENMDKYSTFSNVLTPQNHLTGGADLGFRVDESGTVVPVELGAKAYYITDKAGYDSFYRIRKHSDAGYYKIADTIEDLAKELKVDPAGLKLTIDTHNKNVQDKKEGFENKREFNAEGPYYGAVVNALTHMTKGGVATNEFSQVLTEDGNVVEGLYAAGEVTSQTGCYAASVSWGQIAGNHAGNNMN